MLSDLLSYDLRRLEELSFAYCMRENRKAKRLPARKRKLMYGKAKLPYTIIHDCIFFNCKEDDYSEEVY